MLLIQIQYPQRFQSKSKWEGRTCEQFMGPSDSCHNQRAVFYWPNATTVTRSLHLSTLAQLKSFLLYWYRASGAVYFAELGTANEKKKVEFFRGVRGACLPPTPFPTENFESQNWNLCNLRHSGGNHTKIHDEYQFCTFNLHSQIHHLNIHRKKSMLVNFFPRKKYFSAIFDFHFRENPRFCNNFQALYYTGIMHQALCILWVLQGRDSLHCASHGWYTLTTAHTPHPVQPAAIGDISKSDIEISTQTAPPTIPLGQHVSGLSTSDLGFQETRGRKWWTTTMHILALWQNTTH